MRIMWIFLILLYPLFGKQIPLTPSQKKELTSHPLTCYATSTWPPFNTKIDGKLVGIGIDHWQKIAERLGIPFLCREAPSWTQVLEAVKDPNRHYITPTTDSTPQRKKYAVFSKPFASYPYVIVTREDVGFIDDVHLLHSKKFVVGRNYTIDAVLQRRYPNMRLERVENLEEGLKKVASGEAFAAIDVLPVMAYLLNKDAYADLKISGILPERFSARIMLNKQDASVLPLINRAIDTITPDENEIINYKWVSVHDRSSRLRRYLYALSLLTLLVVGWLYYRLVFLKRKIVQKEQQMVLLEKEASTDVLTQIYNRHVVDDFLSKQIAVAERYQQFFSIIFFDIDDFKMYNDRYGHAAGDDILVTLSKVVNETLRQSDVFGRWGGDEFLIILPESTGKQAGRLVKLIEKRLRQANFPNGMKVSCSFGIASYQYGDSPKEIIERADKNLYMAKAVRKRSRTA